MKRLLLILCLSGPVLAFPPLPEGGQAFGWGYSTGGESVIPTLTNCVQIASDAYWGCALLADGRLVSWGRRTEGQQNLPTGTFIACDAGWHHGLAVRTDGSIAQWGTAWGGVQPPAVNNAVQVAAGDYDSAALLADGSVVCWGAQEWFANKPADLANVIQIDASWYHKTALQADGRIRCWGHPMVNAALQEPPQRDFIYCAAGWKCSYGIRANGELVVWGLPDAYGNLNPPPGQYLAVDGDREHAVAVRTDGTLATWGNPAYGLGSPPAGDGFARVECSYFHSHAIRARPPTPPPPPPQTIFYVSPAGDDLCAGTADAPFRTLQRGLDSVSCRTGQVIVLPGVYLEPIVTGGLQIFRLDVP